MRFFRRRWAEDRGDAHADWGHSWWHFATDDHGVVIEQVEVYDSGRVLAYDAQHVEDEFGSLSDVPLDLDEVSEFEIDAAAYRRAVGRYSRLSG